MNEYFAFINGKFIKKEEAAINITDLAIQRGYGIFDFIRAYNNRPVFIDDHLERFFYSAEKMNLKINYSYEELKAFIHELIEKNNIPESGVKIILTGGYAEDGYTVADANLIITQIPIKLIEKNFDKGIQLITKEYRRQFPRVKTIDYLMGIYMQQEIKQKNADDVLYFFNNEISECPRANFFIVTEKDKIITPAQHVLRGITRKKIMEFPEFDCIEATINTEDISLAKEAFITSSTKNVLPVVAIDGKKIRDGKPGEVTKKIAERLKKLKEAYLSTYSIPENG